MNLVANPDAMAEGESRESRSNNVLWHHTAFCRLALPLRASEKALWQRETPSATVAIASSVAGDADAQDPNRPALPSGKYLRLLLIHLFTTAIETKNPLIELGESPAALAEAMMLDLKGAKLRELADQYARLAATKITVSLDGGPALSVFDARGRPRATGAEWRPSLRLNSRFFEQLTQNAVELDRRILTALTDNVMAMDAYAWIASALPQVGAAGSPVTWQELFQRFGGASAKIDEHRASFEESLQQVSAAWPAVRLIIGEEGVELRRSEREAPPQPARQTAAPAPVVRDAPPRPAAPQLEIPLRPRPEPRPESVAPPQPEVAPPQPEPVLPPQAESAPPPPAPLSAPEFETQPRRMHENKIALKSHQTGLHQVIWLQRDGNGDEVLVEVTPGGRYDPQNVTVLALEPIIVQISGGLYTRDFERVAAWVNANRDLIDDVWYDDVESDEEIFRRVKKVPPPGWR
jgi:Plasmid encoded RepA protein